MERTCSTGGCSGCFGVPIEQEEERGVDRCCQARTGGKSAAALEGADIAARGGTGRTALQEAAYGGHEDVVWLLLKNGANADEREGGIGASALHFAAMHGYEVVVRLLLEKGANVNANTTSMIGFGMTALHCATRCGHEAVVQLLLEKGANVAMKTGRATRTATGRGGRT